MKIQVSPIHSRSRRGFSLLEIMITIVIITVLMLISLPALHLLKKRAYWAKTPRQMAKVVEAFHAYSAEHNGYFPPAYFPDGAGGAAEGVLGDTLLNESGWLNSTIYSQLYPDNSVDAEANDPGNHSDSTDTSVSYEQSDKGYHLKDTVFEVQASVLADKEDDNLYNHSFLLNRSLATDRTRNQEEFAPRKSTIYTDMSSIMLITEGLGGEHFNSISVDDATSEQIEQGFKRYDEKHVYVGFMDGHVEKVKRDDFPEALDFGESVAQQLASHLFWTGVTPQELATLSREDSSRVKY